MPKNFEQMVRDDIAFLKELATKSRKQVATEKNLSLHDVNQWLYRIKTRYRFWRDKYINPISSILGRAEHLKRVFMSVRPPPEIDDEVDDL